jgi:hypothetical protein
MKDYLTRNDAREIFGLCADVLDGAAFNEPIEDMVAREYGDLGQYWMMPFLFNLAEKGVNASEAVDIVFPENNLSINKDELVELAASRIKQQELNLEENEEQTVAVVPVVTPAPAPRPTVRVERKTRQKSSQSLSARAKPLYVGMVEATPNIRNVDAQKQIALGLGIDDPKQLNSLRALIVKFKKELKG